VVVNRHGKFLLGLVLSDDVIVEEAFDLLRFGKMARGGGRVSRIASIVLKN